jgi:hypothetical protein
VGDYDTLQPSAQRLFKLPVFQTKVVEKFKTHILFPIIFFSSKNSAVYELMWKELAAPGGPQMTMARAHCMMDT